MIYAVVIDDFVTNTVVADESEKAEIEKELEAELVDAAPFGLAIGDYRRPDGLWTRNQDGEQIILSERPTYDELVEALVSLGVRFNVD